MHVLPGVHGQIFSGAIAPVVTYVGTDGDPANTGTHTMTVTLAAANKSHRKIVIWVCGSNFGGATFTALTVGGNAATELVDITNSEELAAFYEYDDTSLSGPIDFVSTMSDSGGTRAQVVVWVIEKNGPISLRGSDTHNTDADFALSVAFGALDVVVAGTAYVSGSAPTYAPTAGNPGYISEDVSGAVGGEVVTYTGASTDSGVSDGSGTATITTSGNSADKLGAVLVFG